MVNKSIKIKSIKTKAKFNSLENKKAQVSIEMIIILSILILGAVVLASIMLGFFSSNTDKATEINDKTSGTVDNFLNDLINYNDNNTPESPTPTPTYYNLILLTTGSGSANTSGSYASGSIVTVTASPNSGNTFVNWTNGGTVVSTSANYSFTMPAIDTTLTANFQVSTPTNYNLTLLSTASSGLTGAGSYATGTSVPVSTTIPSGHAFLNWTNGGTIVSSIASFNYTMPAIDTTLTANFLATTPNYTLTVDKIGGSGDSYITSDIIGINCLYDCTESYPEGTTVTLSATPDLFVNWVGDCISVGSLPYCTLNINSATNVTANFKYYVSLLTNGNGSGTITSNPVGSHIGTSPLNYYTPGTIVRFTATPAVGSIFAGWYDACQFAGTNLTCDLNITNELGTYVGATFTLDPNYYLSVTKQGNGTGTVTSTPIGINCGTDCSQNYNYGTMVRLVATPAAGSEFFGWYDDCYYSGAVLTCDLNINKSTGTYAAANFMLSTTTTTCEPLINLRYCSGAGRIWIATSANSAACVATCEAGGYLCCEYRTTGSACYAATSSGISVSGMSGIYAGNCS